MKSDQEVAYFCTPITPSGGRLLHAAPHVSACAPAPALARMPDFSTASPIIATSSNPAPELALQEPRPSVLMTRDFVTSRFGADHAAQADRRATDDRRRAPSALSRRSGVRDAGSPDAATPRSPQSRRSVGATLSPSSPRCRVSMPPGWNLRENLQDSATAEALQAICDVDLTELQAIVPPRGSGPPSTPEQCPLSAQSFRMRHQTDSSCTPIDILIAAPRQSGLANCATSDNHARTRRLLLILIDAPFSS